MNCTSSSSSCTEAYEEIERAFCLHVAVVIAAIVLQSKLHCIAAACDLCMCTCALGSVSVYGS